MKEYSVDNYFPFPINDFLDQSALPFYSTDMEGRITYYNQAADKLWGRAPVIGRDFWYMSLQLCNWEGAPLPTEDWPLAKLLKEGGQSKRELIFVKRPDQKIRELQVFPKVILGGQGQALGIQNTILDITDDQSHDLRQAHLSAIVESSDDAIIGKSLDGTITSWNTAAEKIFKYSEDEILGKHITVLIPGSRQDDEDLIMENIKEGKKVDHYETIRIDKFGKEIPISLTVSPIKDKWGRVVGASKVARDISERQLGEEKQAVLSAIVESSDDAIISKDLNGIISSWNAGAERIFGYSEEEAIRKPISILIPEDRLQEEVLILGQIRSGKRIEPFQTIRKDKFGREFPVSLTVSPIKDSNGITVGASKIARDISAQVKAQEQIEHYARNLEILNTLEKSISGKLDVSEIIKQVLEGTINLTGAAFGAFLYDNGSRENELLQFSLSGEGKANFEKNLIHQWLTELNRRIPGGGTLRLEDIAGSSLFADLPSGLPEIHSFFSVPIPSAEDEQMGRLVFTHSRKGVFTEEHEDLVANIASQASISLENSRLFEKVKSLSDKKDEFIAVASHELKTPLTTIKGYLQVLDQNEQDKLSTLFLEKSIYQVNKLNTLVEDLLNLSRIEAGKLEFNYEVFDFRQLLQDMAETFAYSHKSHQLICDLGEEPVYLEGDQQRLEQVISNFLNNAVKYSPKADKVYLRLEADDAKVRFFIKDEGVGLGPRQQKKIFSRYYRVEGNKGISGLGLGLFLTKKIVDRHHGDISVNSELGKGSEFICTLPRKHR